eukprot:3993194-Prymnesium_polylepis.1
MVAHLVILDALRHLRAHLGLHGRRVGNRLPCAHARDTAAACARQAMATTDEGTQRVPSARSCRDYTLPVQNLGATAPP